MELLEYTRIIYRRLWLVLLLPIVAVSLAVWRAPRERPMYQTNTLLLLNSAAPAVPVGGAPFQIQAAENVDELARSYSEYMRTASFGRIVVEQLGLNVSPQTIAGAITSNLVPGTSFFRITTTWPNPYEAQFLADSVARIFIEENRRLQLASRPADSQSRQDIADSLRYYDRRVKAVRVERDELEVNNRLPEEERQARLQQTEERLQALEDTYVKLLTTSAATERGDEARLNTATIIDPAPVGWGISRSRRLQNFIFVGIAAAAMGIAVAVLLEYLDYTVKTPADIEAMTGGPPLGVVGIMGGRAARRGYGYGYGYGRRGRRLLMAGADGAPTLVERNGRAGGQPDTDGADAGAIAPMTEEDGEEPGQKLSPMLVTARSPRAAISEGFRSLRTNVQFASPDKPVRTIAVTSVLPAEGKTVIASNLAVVLAQRDHRVLLIDADLRRPSVHRMFGLANDVGLANVFLGASLEEVIQPSVVPNLSVVTSGPMPINPAELLDSRRMNELLTRFSDYADIVLFDTPPMGPLTDAVVLASKVDGAILVVWAGKTRRDVTQAALETLKKVGARPLGVVLNMIKPGVLDRYSYYYSYYYSSYYSENAQGEDGQEAEPGAQPVGSQTNQTG